MAKPTRRAGAEMRALAWAARHPFITLIPLTLVILTFFVGLSTVALPVVGLVVVILVWYRAHPPTFDRYVLPLVRRFRRRWLTYIGRRWTDTMIGCDLYKENRRTGLVTVPRIVRVKCPTPTIDIVKVRLLVGQKPARFTDHAEELAAALKVQRVAIEKDRPQRLLMIVERRNPFDRQPIPALDMPTQVSEVDLSALPLGDDEYGNTWTEGVLGRHWLVAGGSGSGKSSLLWTPLRQMAPAIREGLVKVDMIDLKAGMETELGAPIFHRRAVTFEDAAGDKSGGGLVEVFRDEMKVRQAVLSAEGKRRFTPSLDTPLRLLMIDEFAQLSAYGDGSRVRPALKLLGEILTQGRAPGFGVMAYVQEPHADVVPLRALFNCRVCLRVTQASHVDMTLGDGALSMGAAAHEIPLTEEYIGTGFRRHHRTRTPMRVRAAHNEDEDIRELVEACAPTRAEVRLIRGEAS